TARPSPRGACPAPGRGCARCRGSRAAGSPPDAARRRRRHRPAHSSAHHGWGSASSASPPGRRPWGRRRCGCPSPDARAAAWAPGRGRRREQARRRWWSQRDAWRISPGGRRAPLRPWHGRRTVAKNGSVPAHATAATLGRRKRHHLRHSPAAGDRHDHLPQDARGAGRAQPRAISGDPAGRHRTPRHRRVPAPLGGRHLRRRGVRRAAVRVLRQVRFALRLAQLHQADRTGQRAGTARHLARHDPHRGALRTRRQPSRPRLPRWPARARRPALLHQLRLAALHTARGDGGRRLRPLPRPGGGRAMSSERAILAGGCFWGMQELIRRQPGVLSTRVGYAGGDVPNATYRHHGTHAEAVEIVFDPARTSYRALLEFFFQIHDPSTPNRQGNDRGSSYRSMILYTGDAQKRIAEETIADVDASGLWPGKAVTEVAPAGDFWEAEPEHQDYLQHYPSGYTCHYPRPGWRLPQKGGTAD